MKLTFGNESELEEFLISQGVDTSTWGLGSTKSVGDLWKEIQNGDSFLQDSPFSRVVEIVQLIIQRDGLTLMEIEQELDDGRKRDRYFPPSEKKRRGKSPLETAINCIEDEFGLQEKDILIDENSYEYEEDQELKDSKSFPGLPCKYIYHKYNATVEGLPETDFWTSEADRNRDDPVRRHHWSWEPPTPRCT